MAKSFVDVVVHASKKEPPSGTQSFLRASLSYHQLLVSLGFGMNEAPVADLLRHIYGLSGAWLIASPLQWEATHNDAMIRLGGTGFDLDENESRRLFVLFENFVAEENMRAFYVDATTWLLQAEAEQAPSSAPVHVLQNCSMRPALLALEATPFWLRFITETQMLLSAQASRVNGLWIWGGQGALVPQKRSLIVCGDAQMLAVANLLSTQVDLYDPTRRGTRNAVYFVPDEACLHDLDLAFYLRDQHVRWHWNNMTYESKPRHWFARLFGR